MRYIADETIAVKQHKKEKFEIIRILKNNEAFLTYHYIVAWSKTINSIEFEKIFNNVLDYSIDIRKLSNYREISGFLAIKDPKQEVIPIIVEAVKSGELVPV